MSWKKFISDKTQLHTIICTSCKICQRLKLIITETIPASLLSTKWKMDLPSCTFSWVTAMDCIHHGVSTIESSQAGTSLQNQQLTSRHRKLYETKVKVRQVP